MAVWLHQMVRCWICGEGYAGIGSAWKDKGGHGEGWCGGRQGGRQEGVDGEDTLWPSQIGEAKKKKIVIHIYPCSLSKLIAESKCIENYNN